MDRRKFLAAGSLAAAAPALTSAIAPANGTDAESALFKRVNFTSDGLEFDAVEYAAVLQKATANGLEPDYYSNGGVIAQLEQKFANLLGKPAAMFVPTGTLANHLAIRKLAGNDHRVLLQAESHFYNDSGDCGQTLSGLNLVPLNSGGSEMKLEEIKEWVERSEHGRVPTKVGVISIESPVRRKDHELVDFDEMQRISLYAREKGIRLHLDGARMFNLPHHSGKSLKEYAALFDTVYVSLWKHFNGASGAILAGPADFIEGLYHMRRMFGGSLPHAWPTVAPVLNYVDNYQADYANAWHAADQLFALLQKSGRFKIRKLPNGTSRFFMKVTGVKADIFYQRVVALGVLISPKHPDSDEFAMQLNTSVLRERPETLARIFIEAAQA